MDDAHLPAEGQTCEVCSADGHLWCTPVADVTVPGVVEDPYGNVYFCWA